VKKGTTIRIFHGEEDGQNLTKILQKAKQNALEKKMFIEKFVAAAAAGGADVVSAQAKPLKWMINLLR